MSLERIFKNLILLYPVLVVMIVFISVYIDWDIPVESYTETTTSEMIYIPLVAFVINLYALYPPSKRFKAAENYVCRIDCWVWIWIYSLFIPPFLWAFY